MRRFLLTVAAAAISFAFTNSASAATLDSHLGVPPNDHVTLQWQCNVGTPTRLLPDGERVEDFAIPRRQLLVITDLDWRVSVSDGGIGQNFIGELHLTNGAGLVAYPYLNYVQLLQNRGYLSDHLTGGLTLNSDVVLDNGAFTHPRLTVFGVAPGNDEISSCNVILRGYLVRP